VVRFLVSEVPLHTLNPKSLTQGQVAHDDHGRLHGSGLRRGRGVVEPVQGYLAHDKTPTPLGPYIRTIPRALQWS